ncbi:MAG: hypothetical protein AAGD96_26740 [Chloroflexota bacterium]
MKSDDMRKLIIVCMVVATGCDVDTTVNHNDLSGRWDAFWQVDGETLSGEFVLLSNGLGRIEIPGQKGSLLLTQEASADFVWQKQGKDFNLKRLDNDFEMNYKILKESPDQIDMTFADEVYVKLLKQ